MPEDDLIGQALACNHLCNIALQVGDLAAAQNRAEESIRLYRQANADFGALHLHTHLAQIRLMRGDLLGSAEVLHGMVEKLEALPGESDWLIAVARILRAEVAYAANNVGQAEQLCKAALDLVEHKVAWFDILTAAYRIKTRLAYADSGLPGALEALTHAERIARDRGMPRLYRLLQIERLRALTLSDETRTAVRLLSEIGLSTDRPQLEESDDLAFRQGTTFVAVARLMVRTRRAADALEFIGPAEDLAFGAASCCRWPSCASSPPPRIGSCAPGPRPRPACSARFACSATSPSAGSSSTKAPRWGSSFRQRSTAITFRRRRPAHSGAG